MVFSNGHSYRGHFSADLISDKMGYLTYNSWEFRVFYVHILEFNFGIFIEQENESLFVLNCATQSLHGEEMIEKLKESGIDLQESLKNIKKPKNSEIST